MVFLPINGHRINVVAFGPGPRTFLGVGGWAGSWELWQQPFEALSRTWRTVSYDHRGCGETVVPPQPGPEAGSESPATTPPSEPVPAVAPAPEAAPSVAPAPEGTGTAAIEPLPEPTAPSPAPAAEPAPKEKDEKAPQAATTPAGDTKPGEAGAVALEPVRWDDYLARVGADTGAKPTKGKPRAKNRMAELAEQMKKQRATWNPWMMTK